MAQDQAAALQRWELENEITEVENLYKWDPSANQAIQQEKPWTKDPNHFKQ